jgi:Holliday junction resolvase RusA-like endonuclease
MRAPRIPPSSRAPSMAESRPFDPSRLSMEAVIAEAERRKAAGVGTRVKGVVGGVNPARDYSQNIPEPAIAERPARLELVLPWSTLVSDNEREEPTIIAGKPAKRHTAKYREAREKIKQAVTRQLLAAGYALPVYADEVLVERAEIFFPRGHNQPDPLNFAKGVNDALEGLTYHKDAQITEGTWRRAGVDVDAPRCELTLTLLEP